MTDRLHDKLWHHMFQTALETQSIPPGDHITDDDELLTCWSAGLLTTKQVEQITSHLARCRPCCRELARLMRNGTLEGPPDISEAVRDVVAQERSFVGAAGYDGGEGHSTIRAKNWFGGHRRWYATVATIGALAASIWGVWLLSGPNPSTGQLLARAEKQLKEGEPLYALQGAASILARDPTDPAHDAAAKIWEQAAYEVAAKALMQQQFSQVIDIGREASLRNLSSARLLNLKIEADRKIPFEVALAQVGSLLDYGFEIDGSLPRKALPIASEETDRQKRELLTAVELHPKDTALRVNLGQFLLDQGQAGQAREEFQAAAVIDPTSQDAQLGLGLAAASLGEWESALKQFESLLKLDSQDATTAINAAICAERLGQGEAAQRYLRQALELTTDTELRKRIETRILSP